MMYVCLLMVKTSCTLGTGIVVFPAMYSLFAASAVRVTGVDLRTDRVQSDTLYPSRMVNIREKPARYANG